MDIAFEPTSVSQIVRDLQTTNLKAVGALVWLAYDWAIVFEDEVEHIWLAKWTLPRVLYLYIRYCGLVLALFTAWTNAIRDMTYDLCVLRSPFVGFLFVSMVACIKLLLVLRLCALFNNNRRLRILLFVLYFAEQTCETVIVALDTPGVLLERHSFPPASGCLVTPPLRNSSLELFAWLPAVIVNTVFLSLALLKLCPYIRFSSSTTPALLAIFVQDGALLCRCIFNVLVVSAIIPPLTSSTRRCLQGIAIPWMFAVAGTRLLLSLRGASSTSPTETPESFELQIVARARTAGSAEHV